MENQADIGDVESVEVVADVELNTESKHAAEVIEPAQQEQSTQQAEQPEPAIEVMSTAADSEPVEEQDQPMQESNCEAELASNDVVLDESHEADESSPVCNQSADVNQEVAADSEVGASTSNEESIQDSEDANAMESETGSMENVESIDEASDQSTIVEEAPTEQQSAAPAELPVAENGFMCGPKKLSRLEQEKASFSMQIVKPKPITIFESDTSTLADAVKKMSKLEREKLAAQQQASAPHETSSNEVAKESALTTSPLMSNAIKKMSRLEKEKLEPMPLEIVKKSTQIAASSDVTTTTLTDVVKKMSRLEKEKAEQKQVEAEQEEREERVTKRSRLVAPKSYGGLTDVVKKMSKLEQEKAKMLEEEAKQQQESMANKPKSQLKRADDNQSQGALTDVVKKMSKLEQEKAKLQAEATEAEAAQSAATVRKAKVVEPIVAEGSITDVVKKLSKLEQEKLAIQQQQQAEQASIAQCSTPRARKQQLLRQHSIADESPFMSNCIRKQSRLEKEKLFSRHTHSAAGPAPVTGIAFDMTSHRRKHGEAFNQQGEQHGESHEVNSQPPAVEPIQQITETIKAAPMEVIVEVQPKAEVQATVATESSKIEVKTDVRAKRHPSYTTYNIFGVEQHVDQNRNQANQPSSVVNDAKPSDVDETKAPQSKRARLADCLSSALDAFGGEGFMSDAKKKVSRVEREKLHIIASRNK